MQKLSIVASAATLASDEFGKIVERVQNIKIQT